MDGSYIDSHLTQQIEDEIVNNPGRVPADHQPADEIDVANNPANQPPPITEGLRNYYANIPRCQRAHNDCIRARIQANQQHANQVILQV